MAMSHLKVFFSDERMMDMLSDAELGRLIRAVFAYAKYGEDNPPQGRESLIYPMLIAQVDREKASYQAKVANGSKGGRPKTEANLTITENNLSKPNITEPKPNVTKDNLYKEDEDGEGDGEAKQREEVSIAPSSSDLEAVVCIPLVSGERFPITQEDIDHYRELYPAVDAETELRKMVGWCEANPKKKKTKAGVRAFIANWLSKCQDRGGSSGSVQQYQPYKKPDPMHFEGERQYRSQSADEGLSPAQQAMLAELEGIT